MGMTYRDAGVDITAGTRAVQLMKRAVEATHGPEVLGGVGAFGGLFDISNLKDMGSPTLVASADGVGTKTRVAAIMGRYDTVGQDIVNHCTNDILVQGARPLFFLDYIASAVLDAEMVATVVGGAAKACSEVGCALLGGETAEMPGVYTEGEFDLVGTIIGVVDRAILIDGSRIEVGDQVVALASSGLHTNGFSLARRALADHDFHAHYEELGDSLGNALLAPHRAYLNEVMSIRKVADIKGLVHVTGGGLVENPPRVLPAGTAMKFDRSSWTFPPLFKMIQDAGGVEDREMCRTFNVGLGMLIVVPAGTAQTVIDAVGEGFVVGEIVERQGDEAVIL